MKAIAKQQFINKYSKTLVKEGSVVDVSEKRFKEINEAGFGELLVKEKDVDEEIEKKEPGDEEK